VEPNRLNPLFLLQMMMERDIDFCYEKGLFVLSRRLLKKALVLSDFKKIAFRNFGFSPPQIINHFPAVLRIEKLLEDTPVLKRILPFLLVKAEV
jgi:hypothetical protein